MTPEDIGKLEAGTANPRSREMTPFERYEQDCQELVAKYTENVNRTTKRAFRIINGILIANALIVALITLILLLFGSK